MAARQAPLRRGHGSIGPEAEPRLAEPGRERRSGTRARELLGDNVRPSIRYVHSISEVLADVAGLGCDVACLVPAARMSHVESIASNLETMPAKSTYFYPKLLTGLVLNPIHRLDLS